MIEKRDESVDEHLVWALKLLANAGGYGCWERKVDGAVFASHPDIAKLIRRRGRQWTQMVAARFEEAGLTVVYGHNDSVFVVGGLKHVQDTYREIQASLPAELVLKRPKVVWRYGIFMRQGTYLVQQSLDAGFQPDKGDCAKGEIFKGLGIPLTIRHFNVSVIQHLFRHNTWSLKTFCKSTLDYLLGKRGVWLEEMVSRWMLEKIRTRDFSYEECLFVNSKHQVMVWQGGEVFLSRAMTNGDGVDLYKTHVDYLKSLKTKLKPFL